MVALLIMVSLLFVVVFWFGDIVVQIPNCSSLVQITILFFQILLVACPAILLIYCFIALVTLSSNVTLLLLYMVRIKGNTRSKSKSNAKTNVKIKVVSNLVGLICLMLVCNVPAYAVNLSLASNSKFVSDPLLWLLLGPNCFILLFLCQIPVVSFVVLTPNSNLSLCLNCAGALLFLLPHGFVCPLP